MGNVESIPASTWIIATVIGLILFACSAAFYGRVAWKVHRDGGRVPAGNWSVPELMMTIVLAGFFVFLMFNAIHRQASGGEKLGIDSVMPSSLVFLVLSGGILLFLRYGRGFNLGETFGLRNVPLLLVLGWALALVLAVLPITGAANILTLWLLKGSVKPQPLIELFNEVARNRDHLSVAKIFVAGVVIAPCCEEFLFRGFFYGVWKRFLHPLLAAALACILFAAFHTSLTAFAGLLVLAVCLNLAYERTGSLLVPIGMHALFNFTSLCILYIQAMMQK